MATPIPDVWMFEDALEQACVAHVAANGINDPAKQMDDKGLRTPRVEFKAVFNGSSEHYWINQSTREHFIDTNEGRLYAKVVTRRGAEDQDHSRLRGLIRGLLQYVATISTKMTYHRIEKMLEGGTVPDFSQSDYYDISTISFNVKMSILFDGKFAQIFPN